MLTLLFVIGTALAAAGDQAVEKQHILSITAPDIDGGLLAEITWDNGALVLQGVVANPDGSLSGRYLVIPAKGTTLSKLKEQTAASMTYWDKKSRRTSPTGIVLPFSPAASRRTPAGSSESMNARGDPSCTSRSAQKNIRLRPG